MTTFDATTMTQKEIYESLSANQQRQLGWNPDSRCCVVYTSWVGGDVRKANRRTAAREVSAVALPHRDLFRRLREIGECRDKGKTDRLCGELISDLTE